MKLLIYFSFMFIGVHYCRATGFFDLIKWGLDMGAPSFGREAEEEESSREAEENCQCVNGLNCNCCLKLNFTLIDFDEPGCVNIQYYAFDNSLEFNMTFGDNELHTQSVDVDAIEPACMNLVGDVPIAYICATLSNFKLGKDRMKGCIHIEPSILGEAQARYLVGCFGMNNNETSAIDSQRFENGTKVSNNSQEQTSSSEVQESTGSGGDGGEDEEGEENTNQSNSFIEQSANLISNIFYYFSPESEEDDEEEDKKKIVLISSTEVATKEDIGPSELPPPSSTEEDTYEDEGEENSEETNTQSYEK